MNLSRSQCTQSRLQNNKKKLEKRFAIQRNWWPNATRQQNETTKGLLWMRRKRRIKRKQGDKGENVPLDGDNGGNSGGLASSASKIPKVI